MLSDFAEKEKPCLALKNRIFQCPKKSAFSNMPFFSLFRFDQITLEIMLSDFPKKKEFF